MPCSPSGQIQKVKYALWRGGELFPAQIHPTITHITTNGEGERCAYGFDTDDNKCFYFYITFADEAEEEMFINQDWAQFRRLEPNYPHLLASDPPGEPPPGCGTPWNNPCGDPPPLPLVDLPGRSETAPGHGGDARGNG
jgi:hypothetical protein